VEGYGPASYGDTFADVYDEWYAGGSDVASAVARLAELAKGGPALELGIGTGRLALPLAASGVPVTGIDASAEMVARLREKPGGEGIPVVVGDMAMDLPAGPYAVIYVAYNTLFNLLSAERQARCFALAAGRLTGNGAFVVEAFVPDERRPEGGDVEVRELSVDRVVLNVSRHARLEQRVDGQYVELTEASGVRLRPWAIRYAPPEELDGMATRCGLVLAFRWADWNGTPFTAESAYHVSVYRRSASGRA
jgi:SAM-dependent methyltransferase